MAPIKKVKNDDITPEAAKKPSNAKELDEKINESNKKSTNFKSLPKVNEPVIYLANKESADFKNLHKDIHSVMNDIHISNNSTLAAVNAGTINIKDLIKTEGARIKELEEDVLSKLKMSSSDIIESIKEIDTSLISKDDIDSSLQKMSDDLSDKLVSQNQLQIENYSSIIELLSVVNCNSGAIAQTVNELSDNTIKADNQFKYINECILSILDNMKALHSKMESKFNIAIVMTAVSILSSIITLCVLIFS